MAPEIKIIAKFALFGAVGFGIGSLLIIAGHIGAFFIASIFGLVLGFAAMGANGGAGLGLALRDRRKTIRLALWGAIGFGIGWYIPLFLFSWFLVGDPLLSSGFSVMIYIYATAVAPMAIGGAALGLALRSRRHIIGLALAGACGSIIGLIFIQVVAAMGIIIGAFLGAALGYLERGKKTG